MRVTIVGMVVTALLLMLTSCGGGGSSSNGDSPPPAPPPTQASGSTITSTIASAQTGISYSLSIYLPAGYAQSKATYPVIYLMDRETRFAPSLNALQTTGISAILVGIGNMGLDRRFVDFLVPGANSYYRFLTRELVPFIESQYRADPKTRILNGHSLSGLMVMYALFMEASGNRYFSTFISEDGSMREQPDVLDALEQQMSANGPLLSVTLAMSADTAGNIRTALPLCIQLRKRAYVGLNLSMEIYSLGHVPMDVPAFTDSLNAVFGTGKAATGAATSCDS